MSADLLTYSSTGEISVADLYSYVAAAATPPHIFAIFNLPLPEPHAHDLNSQTDSFFIFESALTPEYYYCTAAYHSLTYMALRLYIFVCCSVRDRRQERSWGGLPATDTDRLLRRWLR
eukprot:COSAG05_NODE_1649_length_4339_cov_2.053066_2_plen_118_part_00